ncbi:LLM class flavin-dependent oxidoreductase, partial [Brevibacterium paucivorans]
LLAAVYGDRIDLGIGRAPGTDPFTRMAMWGHLGDGQVVNRDVVVAETEEEAWNLAQPFLYQMANLRVGAPMRSMPTVGRETDEVMSAGHRAVADKLAQTYIIGTPKDAARQL